MITQRILMLLASLTITTYCARAETLYSQQDPEVPTRGYTSTSPYQQLADNFIINGDGSATLNSIRLVGGYVYRGSNQDPIDLPADNFQIVFFEDVGGVPGTPVDGGVLQIESSVQRRMTGGSLLSAQYVPYEFVFDLELTLPRSTELWISVVNDPLPEPTGQIGEVIGWSWARGNGILDQEIAGLSGDIFVDEWVIGDTDTGMNFFLSCEIVPEPHYSLLAPALILLSTRRRKSKSRNL